MALFKRKSRPESTVAEPLPASMEGLLEEIGRQTARGRPTKTRRPRAGCSGSATTPGSGASTPPRGYRATRSPTTRACPPAMRCRSSRPPS